VPVLDALSAAPSALPGHAGGSVGEQSPRQSEIRELDVCFMRD
jgi:hypothetical protein